MEEKLAKIFFDLKSTGWDIEAESVWGEHTRDNQFIIRNIPLHAYGVSLGDTVSVVVKENNLYFDTVVQRGGHSTLRVFLKVSESVEDFVRQQLKPFGELNCAYEGDGKRLYTIDVPPSTDVEKVIQILREGENKKKWEYEEAYVYRSNL